MKQFESEDDTKNSTAKLDIFRKNGLFYEEKYKYGRPLDIDEPGSIYRAMVHGSAQRLLKVERITKYVKFCKCCSLPQETAGVVMAFNCQDDEIDFGLGIYLYFYYIKTCIFMSLITVFLCSIISIVFSIIYSSDLPKYCEDICSKIELLEDKNFENYCDRYFNMDTGTKKEDIDLMTKMSADNLKYYQIIFEYYSQSQKDKINKVVLKYPIIYFLTGITLLIINYIFIIHVNVITYYEELKETTPSDYTILIRRVPDSSDDSDIKDEVSKIIQNVSNYTAYPMDKYKIIPCLKIGNIYKKAKEKYKEETKIYQIYNFESQKKLNEINDYNELPDNLNYYQKFLCCKKKISIQKIKSKIDKRQSYLNDKLDELNKNPKKFNGGAFFIIFPQIKMKEKFYDFFPHNFFGKFFWFLRFVVECILFGCCVKKEEKDYVKMKLILKVSAAHEPYEVIWQNMGYSIIRRILIKLVVIISTIFIIVSSFGVIIGLDIVKINLKDNSKYDTSLKYLISFGISIYIFLTNFLGRKILRQLVKLEKFEYKTEYYISYSLKHVIFEFLNTALTPVAAGFASKEYVSNDLIIDDMLMIFVVNILLPPFIFYLGPELLIKLIKRAKARSDLEDVEIEKSTYTQDELNEIWENPSMDICYKYSYITNVIFISLFFISIFPLGMILGFFGLVFTYISEYIYLSMYRRPKTLNSSLCKFFIKNLKWSTFIFAAGNYIFLNNIYRDDAVTITYSAIFFAICVIPYQTLYFNCICTSKGEINKDTYEDNSLYFTVDYEKLNPLTKKFSYIKYFSQLIQNKIIEQEVGNKIIDIIKNENEMDVYVKIYRNLHNCIASIESHKLLIKNKIDKKIKSILKYEKKTGDIIEDNKSNKKVLSSEELLKMKEYIINYAKICSGLTNAFLFLGIKIENIKDELTHHHKNYNPWDYDPLFTSNFIEKRKFWIEEVHNSLDYIEEISDEEDILVSIKERGNQKTKELIKVNENIESIYSIKGLKSENVNIKDNRIINNKYRGVK